MFGRVVSFSPDLAFGEVFGRGLLRVADPLPDSLHLVTVPHPLAAGAVGGALQARVTVVRLG